MKALAVVAAVAAIHVPAGYHAGNYASGLTQPAAMAFGPDGRLYVAEDGGKVVSVARGDTRPRLYRKGLLVPLGLLWRGRTLYVSESGRVDAFRGSSRRLVLSGLPHGRHQQDAIVAGPGGRRNPYGLACAGRTLYATVNGRDDLGDGEPADEVVRIRPGADYGWPCWPDFALRKPVGSCAGVTPPVAYLEPHSSADGIVSWRGDLFVTEWGEYLSNRHGRVLVRIRRGAATTFASGFDHPLALAVGPSGDLLVADWGRGVIYAISRG